MGRKKSTEDRVLGPYEESDGRGGTRYRVILVFAPGSDLPKGKKEPHIFSTHAEADKYATDARAALVAVESRTIEEARTAFLNSLPPFKGRGGQTLTDRLDFFFSGHDQQTLSWLCKRGMTGKTRAAEIYEGCGECAPDSPCSCCKAALIRRSSQKAKEARTVSAAYQRRALREARRFLAWCCKEKGWLPANPLDGVKGQGRQRKRKQQLRQEEVVRFYEEALKMAELGTPPQRIGAIGVMTALLLTLRQSEVTDRQVRDLDAAGTLLVIDEGKTDASRGTLEVPDDLRPHLLRLAAGRPPEAPLFWYEGRARPFCRTWLLGWTEKICRRAGTPRIVAHALRGQGGSIGATQGALPHLIQQALRHRNSKVTQEHYLDPAAVAAGQQRRFQELLGRASLTARLRAMAERWRTAGWSEPAEELLAELGMRESLPQSIPAPPEARPN